MIASDLAMLVVDLHDHARQLEEDEKDDTATFLGWRLRLLAHDIDVYANGKRYADPEPRPLIHYAAMRTIIAFDQLYLQAVRDLASHERNPGNDLARVKTAASEQMRDDARAKVAQALRRWASQVEQGVQR